MLPFALDALHELLEAPPTVFHCPIDQGKPPQGIGSFGLIAGAFFNQRIRSCSFFDSI